MSEIRKSFKDWVALREMQTPMMNNAPQMNTMTSVQQMFTALNNKMSSNPGDPTIKQDVQKLMPLMTKWQQELNAPPKPAVPTPTAPKPGQPQQPQQAMR